MEKRPIRAFFADEDEALDKLAVISLIGLAINGSALALTASRVAVSATFCSVVLIFLATNIARTIRLRDRVTVITAIVMLAAGVIYFMPDLLSQRVSAFESDAQIRWGVYQRFWEMTQAAPWTGFGPGAFPQVNIYFMRDVSIHMRDMWIFNSPYSVLLQLWFVGGLPYVILIIAASALIARNVLTKRRWRHVGNREMATVLSIAVIFAVGLINIPLDVPASADLAILLVGLAWACEKRVGSRAKSCDDPASHLKGLARPSL